MAERCNNGSVAKCLYMPMVFLFSNPPLRPQYIVWLYCLNYWFGTNTDLWDRPPGERKGSSPGNRL
jgi:hypothetical protein